MTGTEIFSYEDMARKVRDPIHIGLYTKIKNDLRRGLLTDTRIMELHTVSRLRVRQIAQSVDYENFQRMVNPRFKKLKRRDNVKKRSFFSKLIRRKS